MPEPGDIRATPLPLTSYGVTHPVRVEYYTDRWRPVVDIASDPDNPETIYLKRVPATEGGIGHLTGTGPPPV